MSFPFPGCSPAITRTTAKTATATQSTPTKQNTAEYTKATAMRPKHDTHEPAHRSGRVCERGVARCFGGVWVFVIPA